MEPEHKIPKALRFKRFHRRWRRRAKRVILGLVRWKVFGVAAPAASGIYMATLDIWSDKWAWIYNHQSAHETAFITLAGLTFGVLFLRGIVGEEQRLDSSDVASEVLSSFMETVGAIVEAKTTRFKKAIPNIKPSSNKFKHITHPEDQMAVISNALVAFISNNFAINANEIDITILRKKPSRPWHYYYKHQKWNHTDPNKLMDGNSAAASCLKSLEPEFYPDKIAASEAGKYRLSQRDVKRREGSVFVYPISVELPEGKVESVVSIVTYGKQFCENHESPTKTISSLLLSEICRRYQLELYLDAIKTEC